MVSIATQLDEQDAHFLSIKYFARSFHADRELVLHRRTQASDALHLDLETRREGDINFLVLFRARSKGYQWAVGWKADGKGELGVVVDRWLSVVVPRPEHLP
jgi:hypothetical protein